MSDAADARAAPMPERLDSDRARALSLVPVSRETVERLDRFVALLQRWQASINLIAPSTVDQLWTRHIADSLQLIALAPDAKVWIDLGSGGGFPGLVVACALAGRPGTVVHLVESNHKKAAFLREAARVTGAPAVIHATRIETFAAEAQAEAVRANVVTARALARLKVLVNQSFRLFGPETIGLFPKGQDVDGELTEASKCWNMTYDLVPSRTDSKGRIVVVRALNRKLTQT